MKIIITSMILITPLLFVMCGNPDVDVNGVGYEAKIVVDGYLYANEPVHNIKIMRNIPIGSSINVNTLYLSPSTTSVNATINGSALQFDPVTKTYYNNDLVVECGQSYTLNISAVIDGKQLNTQSTTTVPLTGFKLLNNLNLGNIKYNHDQIILKFNPSPNSSVYLFSYLINSATINNFIYNNPYVTNISSNDVSQNWYDYVNQYDIVTNISPDINNEYSYNVEDYKFWFYGQYTITAYAGDKNFKDFVLSASNVEEFDGNFHEPVVDFQGDGIGVFASAIKDTLTFRLIK
jgi:hypothetical protein